MPDSDDPFGAYEHSYGRAVDDVVAFSHQGHEFFTRAKVLRLIDVVTRQLGNPSSQRVLDIGCGPGATDAMLVPHVGHLSGVDVSQAMVDQARRTTPAADYQVYDGAVLPYDDDAFDVTFAICVLHHVEPRHWAAFTAEIGRVTRPGGLSIVFEHNPYNPLTRRAVRECPFDDGVTLLTRRTSMDLCGGAAQKVVESRYMLFVPIDQEISAAADRILGRVPLGGQYYVAARIP